MTTPQRNPILQHIRRMAAHLEDLPDRELLQRYVLRRDEEVFARLMRRHRPLVQGVALRILGNWHDSEDVVQAAFLVLARKAGSLRWRDSIACWLYRVAHHLALKTKAAADRRRAKERQAAVPTAADAFDDIRLSEARTLLDMELTALPQRYRAPILLCCLEATTQEEAARQLGCSLATLKRRLSKGRELLRIRLARRGLTLSAALMPALLSAEPTAATAMTLISPSAAALTLAEGALRAMTAAKLKIAAASVLVVSMLTAGTGLVMQQVGSQPPAAAADRRTAGVSRLVEHQETRKDCYGDDLPPGARARLGTVRFRHGDSIWALDLSPDGRSLLTGGANWRLHLWDVATGKEVRHFPQEKQSSVTYAAVFSPDGKTFATGGHFGFSLWQTSNGKCLYSVEWTQVYSLAFSPDGKTLATGTREKGPVLWDAATGKRIAQLQEQAANPSVDRFGDHALAFAPNGRLFASTYGNSVILWDVAKRKEIRRLQGHDNPVRTIAFSPDGKLLASAGDDKTIRLWDAATWRELRSFKGHEIRVAALVFSTDGKMLISSSIGTISPPARERRSLRLWDVATGKERGAIDEHSGGTRALALSRDGKLLVAADGGCIRLWDPVTLQEIRPRIGHRNWIADIAFAPDGKWLATAGRDRAIRLWDAATGRQLRDFARVNEPVSSVAFSPDGRSIAAATWDGFLYLWDITNGREIARIRGHEAQPVGIAFSPNGKRLASAGYDGTAKLWDVAAGRELFRFKGDDAFHCVAFSPDGKRIAAAGRFEERMVQNMANGSRQLVRVWDAATGKQIHTFVEYDSISIQSVAFSPDNAVLAASGWDKTSLWDMATGKQLHQIPARSSTLAFSPDGRTLATGGLDDTIRLWETATWKERAHFRGHQEPNDAITLYFYALAFSPDGRTLASSGRDTTALLWDVYGLAPSPRLFDGEKYWQALAHVDAAKAYQAISDLVAHPRQAVPLLRQRLPVARTPGPQRMARLLAELDSDRFEIREKAMQQIEKIGEPANPALQKALEGKPSLEVRLRIKLLLSRIDPVPSSPQQMRLARAMEVLEHMGTPESRRLLQMLASGAAEARLTREAKASLVRLTSRKR